MQNSNSSLDITNCTFTNNSATSSDSLGGAIYFQDGSFAIDGVCTIPVLHFYITKDDSDFSSKETLFSNKPILKTNTSYEENLQNNVLNNLKFYLENYTLQADNWNSNIYVKKIE